MKLKYYIQTGVVALAAATVGVSCTDTWDDHYSVNGTVPGATRKQLDEHSSFREGYGFLWLQRHFECQSGVYGLGSGNYGCGSSGVD